MSSNTILLKGNRGRRYEEAIVGVAFKPGHLIEEYNVAGVKKLRKHSIAGGAAQKAFAIEDAFQGLTIDDAYVVGGIGRYILTAIGEVVQARLPANAAAVVIGDKLVSNGDGTLIKSASYGTHTLYSNVVASAAIGTSSTAEAAFDKSYTIPANTLVAGDVIDIDAQGIVTASHTTDTLTVKLKIGTTVIASSGALDVADNDIVKVHATLIIRDIGATGHFVASGFVTIGTAGTSTVKAFYVASTAIDTTATQLVSLTGQFSASDAGNAVRLDMLAIERAAVSPQELLAVAVNNIDNSAVAAEAWVEAQLL